MLTQYNPAKVGVLEDLRRDGFRVFVSHHRLRQDALYEEDEVRNFILFDDEDQPTFPEDIFATRHMIIFREQGYINREVEQYGGATTVDIYKGEQFLGRGLAVCSKRDTFNKHLGLTIALGRALKSIADEALTH